MNALRSPIRSRPHGVRASYLALICATAAFLACGETSTDVDAWQPAYQLDGTWEWVSSLEFASGATHTPESVGYVASLRFEATSPNRGTFVYEVTGEDVIQGNFAIGSEDAHGNDFIAIEPGINFLPSHAWIGVGTEQLTFTGFTSGHESIYVRVAD